MDMLAKELLAAFTKCAHASSVSDSVACKKVHALMPAQGLSALDAREVMAATRKVARALPASDLARSGGAGGALAISVYMALGGSDVGLTRPYKAKALVEQLKVRHASHIRLRCSTDALSVLCVQALDQLGETHRRHANKMCPSQRLAAQKQREVLWSDTKVTPADFASPEGVQRLRADLDARWRVVVGARLTRGAPQVTPPGSHPILCPGPEMRWVRFISD